MNHAILGYGRSEKLDKLLNDAVSGKTLALTGLGDGQSAFLAAYMAEKTGKRVLLVTSNDLKLSRAADDLQQLIGDAFAALPGGELDLIRSSSSHETSWRRLEALARLAEENVRVFAVSMDALIQRMGDPELFRAGIRRLAPGDIQDPEQLVVSLCRHGYERVGMVEGKGQCSLRGSVLDVYPPNLTYGVRLEFFDDEVDSVRSFDVMSQRSQDTLNIVTLCPASEVILADGELSRAADRLRDAVGGEDAVRTVPKEDAIFEDLPPLPDDDEQLADLFDRHVAPKLAKKEGEHVRQDNIRRGTAMLLEDADRLEVGGTFSRIRVFLPVLTDRVRTLLDWYRADVILLSKPDLLRDRCEERMKGFGEDLASAIARGEAVRKQEELLMTWEELVRATDSACTVLLSDFQHGLGGLTPSQILDLNCSGIAAYRSQLRDLKKDCDAWLAQDLQVVLLSGGVARGRRLQDSLKELGLSCAFREETPAVPPRGTAVILPFSLEKGFNWPDAGLVIVSDVDIWGSGYRKAKTRSHAGERIAAFTDLKVGDLVVHEDHGVGIYGGTTRIQSEGTWRDYLLIRYQGTDKLYVPIEQLERVQRYIGNPDQPPKLNSLGSDAWKKQKGKVRESLRTLAFDLKALYARRSANTGYAFPPDTPWQREFEDRFPYELTPDQAQSVREISMDMESAKNMDRLLCGDVGYGKTEVSLRAAFKAIAAGKQVAILAPTTVLVQQHYHTILKRFDGFGVNADYLNRFRTAKETRTVMNRLAAGEIDLIVGTHRLLAKDVRLRDLGLLIVDEEQRFGVAHKEIIKNMKNQVDVLTLSATPIPRTLHMSMVGIRDMSVLETPPEERLPVQTRVVDYSDAMIRDAILRELSRGGQVYFLYNRVQSIEQFFTRLKALVPEARIGIAHGQMKEHGLEDAMMDFYAGTYNVLLCTTIIESGLDVPTANTLIVYDADRFGLSQLYQLRGRVGRSNRQAYAWFTVRPDKMLSETAQQRLDAIREFTEFGAGFRIAMRDLEIRGAGNLLGPEQHGHLATVGYDMYCKLMEETLAEVQGVLPARELETRVDLQVDAYLPEDYVSDARQRMEMYKRIASVTSKDDRGDIIDELVDRFGEPPQVVLTLLDVALLRHLCNRLGIDRVFARKDTLIMRLDEKYVPEGQILLTAMAETDRQLSLTAQVPFALTVKDTGLMERDLLPLGLKLMTKMNAVVDRLTEETKAAEEKKAAETSGGTAR